mgnify:FL=1
MHNNTCHTCASYWPGCIDCVYNSKTESEKAVGSTILNTLDLNPINPLDNNFRLLQAVVSTDLDGDGYSGGQIGEDVVSKQVYDPVTERTTTEYFEVSKCL